MTEIIIDIERKTTDINVTLDKKGGTSNYNDLINKPSINGVELSGNKTTADLGIEIDTSNLATKEELEQGLKEKQPVGDYALKSEIPTKTSQLENNSGFITELPSLEGYAKTEDIPTKTSELENDSKFVDETLLGQTGQFLVNEIDYTKGLVNELSEKVDNLPTGGAEYTAGDGITISENNEIISNTVIRSKGVWNSTTAYKAGEIVTYNIGEANGQRKFMCIADNTGVTPTIFSTNSYWAYIPTQDYLVATSSSDVPICCAKSNGASGSYATAWRINVPKMATHVSKLPTVNLQTGLMKCPSGIEGYYTKDEVDALVGDLGTILDEINGEII